MTILDLLDPEDKKLMLARASEGYQPGKHYLAEYCIHHPDGSLRWLRDRSRCTEMTPAGYVLEGIIMDITESRQAEQALQASENRLQERERFLSNLLANLPGIVYRASLMHNQVFQVEFVSEGVHDLLEVSPETFTSGQLAPGDLIDPQNMPGLSTWLDHPFEVGASFSLEYRIRTPSGVLKWVRNRVRCVDRLPEKMVFEGIMMDITEARQADQALRRRLEREKLLAQISHSFINISDQNIDEAIGLSLRQLGQFAEADRSYFRLVSWGEKRIERAWDWQSTQVAPRVMTMQGLNLTQYPWSYSTILSGRTVIVHNIKNLPPEAAAEKTLWQELGIVSIIMAPIFFNNELVGVIGFNTERVEREWNQEDGRLLILVGEILINTLENRQAAQALRESEARWRTVFNEAGIGIDLVDTDGCLIEANPALQASCEPCRARTRTGQSS